ncbi:hypothetical protein NKDENANG_00619 [Candidatus Entotheonellaceae bacterium PAL068K]
MGSETFEFFARAGARVRPCRAYAGLYDSRAGGLIIEEAARFFAAFLENQTVLAPCDDLLKGQMLKLAYEDIKAYARRVYRGALGRRQSPRARDGRQRRPTAGVAAPKVALECLSVKQSEGVHLATLIWRFRCTLMRF